MCPYVDEEVAMTSRLELRLPEETKTRLAIAAAAAEESISEFVRAAAEQRADMVLGRDERTIVPPDFFDALLTALDEPAEPNEALRRSAARVAGAVTRVG